MIDDPTDLVTIESPLYLVITNQACNLCGTENPVMAIGTQRLTDEHEPEDDDGYLLCYIEELPTDILAEVLKHHPNFELRDSLTAGQTYYMNTCKCGGHYGDHYVQNELFEKLAYETETVSSQLLNLSGKWDLPCGYSQSSAAADFLGSQKAS